MFTKRISLSDIHSYHSKYIEIIEIFVPYSQNRWHRCHKAVNINQYDQYVGTVPCTLELLQIILFATWSFKIFVINLLVAG